MLLHIILVSLSIIFLPGCIGGCNNCQGHHFDKMRESELWIKHSDGSVTVLGDVAECVKCLQGQMNYPRDHELQPDFVTYIEEPVHRNDVMIYMESCGAYKKDLDPIKKSKKVKPKKRSTAIILAGCVCPGICAHRTDHAILFPASSSSSGRK